MTSTEEIIKLKPCPFCGETDITHIDYDDGTVMIGCTNCSAEAHYFDWNKRVVLKHKDGQMEDNEFPAHKNLEDTERYYGSQWSEIRAEYAAMLHKLDVAEKALREIICEHENHAPAERKMHNIAKQALIDMGVKE